MTIRYDSETTGGRSNTIAAIFATERDARYAVAEVRRAGFKQTWLGKTREADRDSGQPTVEVGNMLARFLSAGTDRRPLHAVLIEHGVSQQQAGAIENDIAPGCVVVTVYGEDDPQRAASLLADEHGQVIDASDALPAAGDLLEREDRDRAVDRDRDRGDDVEYRDVEGYDIEEFIATGRSGF